MALVSKRKFGEEGETSIREELATMQEEFMKLKEQAPSSAIEWEHL